jgi:hypothetical protein
MDPVSVGAAVSGAISAGSHILSLLKGAAESAKAHGKAEVINDLIEVQLAMMDLLQKQQALIEENQSLRNKLNELQSALEDKSVLEVHHDSYWKRLDEKTLDGPFSMTLWDTNRKLVRMRYQSRGELDGIEKYGFYCPTSNEYSYVPTAFLRENNVKHVAERNGEID